MFLKSLKLQNIRSYVEETVTFPSGSCLLAGDIGSGKSTILLSIEFALFGVKRGELEASSLLRNGEHTGRIELVFSLFGKDITICRTLKRTPTSVKQDAGYFVITGLRQDATATELRAKIVELLGYPKEAVTKKDLLYRYTVFTPQEEMRKILYDDAEIRLNTLRKIFQIDKYKRIRDNAQFLAKDMRAKIRILEETMHNLHELETRRDALHERLMFLDKQYKGEKAIFVELNGKKVKIENELAQIEQDIALLQQLQQKKSMNMVALEHRIQQMEDLCIKSEVIDTEILADQQKLNRPILKKTIESLEKEILALDITQKKKIEQRLVQQQKHLLDVTAATATADAEKNATEKIITRMQSLNSCSLCLQHVEHEHKQRIIEKQELIFGEISRQIASLIQQKKKVEKEIVQQMTCLKEAEIIEQKKHALEREVLIRKSVFEKELLTREHIAEQIKDKKVLKKQYLEEKFKLELIEKQLRKTIDDINHELVSFKNSQAGFIKLKKELHEVQNIEKRQEIILVSIEKEREGLSQQKMLVENDIVEKLKTRKIAQQLKMYAHWLDDFFVPLLDTMEKHVMLQVHAHFTSFFTSWFATLIDDETINARLDEVFTPVIEQNGYDTALTDLSGGEKTAVALAYRLSLHKVINDFVRSIHTRDLIILDEPTDGFSAQQLDKVRDVLQQLDIRQIILVSHENKVESFVEHVLRIEKNGHVSTVLQ